MLTEKFETALVFAAQAHRTQVRKGGDIPYLGHLLGVAATVIEEGGDETQAIAALLHDAAEDQGGEPMLDRIRARFGSEVANIVRGCTDTLDRKKYSSQQRKKLNLKHLETATKEVLLVSLADKLFNARAVMLDLRRLGPSVWDRFNTGVESQLKFYRALVGAFRSRGDQVPQHLVDEFDRVVRQIEQLSGTPSTGLEAEWPAGPGA